MKVCLSSFLEYQIKGYVRNITTPILNVTNNL